MKNFTLGILGLIIVAATSSCTKNYTCTCVYPNSTIGTTTTTIKAKKKSDAEATCRSQHLGAQAQGGSCAL